MIQNIDLEVYNLKKKISIVEFKCRNILSFKRISNDNWDEMYKLMKKRKKILFKLSSLEKIMNKIKEENCEKQSRRID